MALCDWVDSTGAELEVSWQTRHTGLAERAGHCFHVVPSQPELIHMTADEFHRSVQDANTNPLQGFASVMFASVSITNKS